MHRHLAFVGRSLRGNFIKTMSLALRKNALCVTVFPDVGVSVASSSRIVGDGTLLLGRKWPGMRYLPSAIKLAKDAQLKVEGRFSIFSGFHLSINEGAKLTLGSGFINMNATLDCFDSITIGQKVSISNGVTIRDSDNHSINGNKVINAPIAIGDHVWIGLNVTILKGVTIGSGSVIAAGAVVINDVPEKTLVGGVPARIIKENVIWE